MPPLDYPNVPGYANGNDLAGNSKWKMLSQQSGSVLCEGATVSQEYAFIAAEGAVVVAVLCPHDRADAAMVGVSKTGFYEWLNRPLSVGGRRGEELKCKSASLFESFDATYGYRRVHAELIRGGEQVGLELVRTLMRELNLGAVQTKPYKRTTIAGEPVRAVSDLVARDFTADRPGVRLVGEITYQDLGRLAVFGDRDWLLQQGRAISVSGEIVGLAGRGSDAELQVLEATCANPRCDEQFQRELGPGRRKDFHSDECRRRAEQDRRRLVSLLRHYERQAEQMRARIAAYVCTYRHRRDHR